MTYKTPGVYVEEIVKFPPSVAQVETAIPAFIGYTEKATKKTQGDLGSIPTRITSMLDYETYFGFAEKETTIEVAVTNFGLDNEEVIVSKPTTPSPFKMYYNLQMYFANGGGPCYIVSVGTYTTSKTNNAVTPVIIEEQGGNGFMGLKDGLDEIAKVDEPTLLVFPDATSLSSSSDFYGLYNSALAQCNKLQDRFTIIDTYSDLDTAVTQLRTGIRIEKDFLKYGATYFPHIETILDYAYEENSVNIMGLNTSLSDVVAKVINDINFTEFEAMLTELITLKQAIEATATNDDALAFKNSANILVKRIITFLETNTNAINALISKSESIGDASLTAPITNLNIWMDANIETIISELHAKLYKLEQDDTKAKLVGSLSTNATNVYGLLGVDEAVVTSTIFYVNLLGQTISDELFILKTAIDALGVLPTPTLAEIKDSNNALYNKVKTEIGLMPIKLTPSSAMAGVYARVDENRGVWKAPANVGLNYVVKPSVQISHEDQKALNVDVVAGKSINAIRTFTGKGVLVWGARTLAGNDNEWRYVSVRRFFNMAEESIKKATEQFVFEPNDKNTWVRVKAMIDNFLTTQWKAGALAGPTPDKAFYVSVGLGETMTAQDILEGNMIVEIGMAAVRPAEFIVLKFSHKMQEA